MTRRWVCLLMIAWAPFATVVVVHGFASYMTSTANCFIELDPSEVVMNHRMVAAPAWSNTDTTNIRIVVTDLDGQALPTQPHATRNDRQEVPVTQFPVQVHVQVTGTQPDAQYVLQVAANDDDSDNNQPYTYFTDGRCDQQARTTGRINDAGATLTIHAPATHLWGGWAAGHEAVRLLPGFVFVLGDDEAPAQDEPASIITSSLSSWTDFMVTEQGCTSVPLSDLPVKVHDRDVQPTVHQARLEVQQSLPHHAYEIGLSVTTTTVQDVVVEVSTGAQWQDAVCDGAQRRVLTNVTNNQQPTVALGTLQIDQDTDETSVTVRALYSVTENQHVVYTAEPLTIAVDPQKQVERQARRDPRDILAQIQGHVQNQKEDDVKNGEVQERGVRYPKDVEEPDRYPHDHHQRHASDSEEDDHPGLFGKERKARKHEEMVGHRKYRLATDRHTEEDPLREIHRKRRHSYAQWKPLYETAKRRHMEKYQDVPTVSFDGRYFGALLFFVGSTAATIQLCRMASMRVSKGRRDL